MSPCRAFWSVVVVVGLLVFAPLQTNAQQCGPWDGDGYQYGDMNLAARVMTGAFAIPAGMGTWDGCDWGLFGAFSSTTLALMVGRPSVDVHFQEWVQDQRWEGGERGFVRITSARMFGGLVGFTAIMAGSGWAFDRPDLIEFTSLMIEAVAITHFYHVMSKLLLGREGPYHHSGQGLYHGVRQVYMPGGTPSGHAATVFAVLGTAAEYYDNVYLRILTVLAGVYSSASLVYHNQHFISDVIWGSAMGYFVARWVVRHHSTRYRCGEPMESSITWMPIAVDRGFGLAVSGTF